MQPAAGDILEKAYINHALGYASSFKRRVDGSDRPTAELGESVLRMVSCSAGYLSVHHLDKEIDLRIGYFTCFHDG
jgi:hypothetical protein